MQLSPSKSRALEFPIGDTTYTVPPAGIADGMRLAEILTTPAEQRAKLKMSTVDLFKLALGDVWTAFEHDGVPYTEAFRAGMACLAREQVLLTDSGPDRWENAERAAQAVWESGVDPEALAAWTAANQQTGSGAGTKPSTRTGAATTTRKPASGTGTKSRTTSRKPAKRSAGSSSARRGR